MSLYILGSGLGVLLMTCAGYVVRSKEERPSGSAMISVFIMAGIGLIFLGTGLRLLGY